MVKFLATHLATACDRWFKCWCIP